MFPSLFTVYAQIKDWEDSGCIVADVPTLKCLEVVFGNILFISSAFIVLVLFIMLVIGALKYLTSFGNAEKVKKAQATILYALIGFGLFISAYLILKLIDFMFLGNQGNIFRFQIGE
jgi:hypothetical protein